jgi:hypothetical protein
MRFLFAPAVLLIATQSFAAEFPKFKTQEIDAGLKIGYAVLTADFNGDGKPDIVVVDKHQVVWYENPTWKKRIILNGKTKPDNVCAAAVDIDGDGLPEIVLGSAWNPSDTLTPGQLSWLKRGKSLDDEWTMHELPCDEPTVHRVRVFDIDGDGKPEIVHVPLQGKGASAKGNFTDGRPVRVIALKIPAKDPEKKENWKTQVLSEELHVCHNFAHFPLQGKGSSILIPSFEGLSVIERSRTADKWMTERTHPGNQANPKSNRGASEIKFSNDKLRLIATIEPWHGNQVVVYTPGNFLREPDPYVRHVIDEQLRWGHAVWFADLDGDGADELIVGVRDDPNAKDTFKERRGVRIYKCTDGKGAKWERMLLDEGGVAVEDLCAADLNGDGKIDIIAVGRATGNCRIYWNQGK